MEILLSALILAAVGVLFAVLIALVYRRFKVWEDPRVDAVVGLLPGTNCGACGFAGCRDLAEKLVARAAKPASCTVISDDNRADVAAYLGVEEGDVHRRTARLLCAGGSDVAPQLAGYVGLQTCRAAAAVAGGGKACPWGCLGLADCVKACTFDAMYLNEVALPVVIPERCTACGDCVRACPRDLFVILPLDHKLIVQCKSPLAGEAAEALCRVACNACGKCVLDAAPGVIQMVNGLAVVDYNLNELAGPEAMQRCPTGAIAWVENRQFVPSHNAAAEVVLT
ncbi:MAG: 4Fe-4S binding protein [Gemmatimonadetes bacterium]|nr:4Fe-4S binding protein [Gemmatimonadota bacterium]